MDIKVTNKQSQVNKQRTTNLSLDLETYGTETQRNLTIKKLINELEIKGFKVKLKNYKTTKSE